MGDAIRIGAAASALGVSIDTLRRWERRGLVAFERRGTQRWLPAAELGRLLADRARRDGTAPTRNRLEGVVVAVRRDGVHTRVDLACGPHRITAMLSREAADTLHLQPGDPVTAVIRAQAVAVEPA